MSTWNEYKNYVHEVDLDAAKDMDEAADVASIVSAMIKQRNALGLSQRDLAAMCEIPQSSVARIESYRSTPNLETLLKIFYRLGLKLSVTATN